LLKKIGNIVGVLTGHSYYMEVYISDLIVLEEHRNKNIGSKLVQTVEEYHKSKGFENINLTTYSFQAPEFYKKCGFELDFIRENKENPKLTKYFFVKYF
jgi:ribosomal protein S18 acetylase RimI-like enzyme